MKMRTRRSGRSPQRKNWVSFNIAFKQWWTYKTSEHLLKDWNSPIYMFFKPTPSIEYINSWRVHVFKCTAKGCKGHGNGHYVHCYLDTSNVKSMSNPWKHAKICWTDDVVALADKTKDVKAAQEALANLKNVDISIMAAFERVAKSKVTYSHWQHTKTEARYVIATIHHFDFILMTLSVLRLSVGLLRASNHSKSSTIVDFRCWWKPDDLTSTSPLQRLYPMMLSRFLYMFASGLQRCYR